MCKEAPRIGAPFIPLERTVRSSLPVCGKDEIPNTLLALTGGLPNPLCRCSDSASMSGVTRSEKNAVIRPVIRPVIRKIRRACFYFVASNKEGK